MAEVCGEIGKANQELEQIRTDLQLLKQIKVCPSCGSENSSDARFCSQCSAALPELTPRQEPQLEGQVCTQCGAPVLENAQFCTKCGARLNLPKEEPQPAGLPADPPDECFAPQPEDNDNR